MKYMLDRMEELCRRRDQLAAEAERLVRLGAPSPDGQTQAELRQLDLEITELMIGRHVLFAAPRF